MKSFELTPGQLVEYSNSANTRRVRGRFVRWEGAAVVIAPLKTSHTLITLNDPEGARVKPVEG